MHIKECTQAVSHLRKKRNKGHDAWCPAWHLSLATDSPDPLSLAFPSSLHGSLRPQPPTYFPHDRGRRLISQATLCLPRCWSPQPHGLAPSRVLPSGPVSKRHADKSARKEEQHHRTAAAARDLSPAVTGSHQRLEVRPQLLLPLQLQLFMDPLQLQI
jgi:hypothetical protein